MGGALKCRDREHGSGWEGWEGQVCVCVVCVCGGGGSGGGLVVVSGSAGVWCVSLAGCTPPLQQVQVV